MNIFVLDFETTGLNPYLNEPIEIAIKKLNKRQNFQSLIIPSENNIHYKYIPPEIVELTNITDSMIDIDGVDKYTVIFNVCKFLETNTNEDSPIYILSHNGNSFDFLIFRKLIYDYNKNHDYDKIESTFIDRIKYIDTILVAKLFIKNEKLNQPRLCQKYNIHNNNEHRAYGDILALEQLYEKLCEQYSHKNGFSYNHYIDNPEDILENIHCN